MKRWAEPSLTPDKQQITDLFLRVRLSDLWTLLRLTTQQQKRMMYDDGLLHCGILFENGWFELSVTFTAAESGWMADVRTYKAHSCYTETHYSEPPNSAFSICLEVQKTYLGDAVLCSLLSFADIKRSRWTWRLLTHFPTAALNWPKTTSIQISVNTRTQGHWIPFVIETFIVIIRFEYQSRNMYSHCILIPPQTVWAVCTRALLISNMFP